MEPQGIFQTQDSCLTSFCIILGAFCRHTWAVCDGGCTASLRHGDNRAVSCNLS